MLDRLDLPGVVAIDSKVAGPVVSADPIAVPTPTAAGSGLALMGAIIACRLGRRIVRGA